MVLTQLCTLILNRKKKKQPTTTSRARRGSRHFDAGESTSAGCITAGRGSLPPHRTAPHRSAPQRPAHARSEEGTRHGPGGTGGPRCWGGGRRRQAGAEQGAHRGDAACAAVSQPRAPLGRGGPEAAAPSLSLAHSRLVVLQGETRVQLPFNPGALRTRYEAGFAAGSCLSAGLNLDVGKRQVLTEQGAQFLAALFC